MWERMAERPTHLYPQTSKAFSALIAVEIATHSLVRTAQDLAEALKGTEGGCHTNYVPHPNSTDDSESKERLRGKRGEAEPEVLQLWTRIDRYLEMEREFREALEEGKLAAEAAVWELDSPATPPLRRTTIAIKRSLRNLGGIVPFPVSSHWSEVAQGDRVAAIVRHLQKVTTWVEELRLLVRPPHQMPPAEHSASKKPKRGGVKRASKPAKPELTNLETEALSALDILQAHGEGSRKTAAEIAEKAVGDGEPGRVKNPLAALRRRGLVGSKEGRSGGTWITKEGLHALRVSGQKLAETRTTV